MATYIDNVKATIALRRFLRSQRPLELNDPIWDAFTTAHYNLLAELIESPLSLVVNNHQGVLSREHNTENDLTQFYIRVQEWDRNELLDTLPLYSKNFPSDKDWVTEVIGQLKQKPDSISVSLLDAGVTTSTTAQRRAEADNLQSKSGGTRLLNWFSLTTGRHPSVFTIQKLRMPPVTDREHFYTQIGYIEDIFIKAIGACSLNSANVVSIQIGLPNQSLQELWRKVGHHLQDFANFLSKVSTTLNIPPPTDRFIESVIQQATPETYKGHVVSVLMGKDVTLANYREAASFWDRGSGRSAVFIRGLFEQMHGLANQLNRSLRLLALVDMFGISPKS